MNDSLHTRFRTTDNGRPGLCPNPPHKDSSMPDLIDSIFFQQLAAMPAEDVCSRTGCTCDDREGTYTITLWDRQYRVQPRLRLVGPADPGPPPLHPYLELFLVHYLIRADGSAPGGHWISEKDISGGVTFFRGPHAIPGELITARFNNDIEVFNRRCRQLQGIPLDLADAAWRFAITPRMPVAVLYWRGDDEFPAEAKLLFDAAIGSCLAADVVYALAVGICHRLGRKDR